MELDLLTFIIFSLATFRMARLLTTDVIFEPLRNFIWKRSTPDKFLGYLFTCNWCMSIWTASFIVICYTIIGTVTVLVALPFALSAVAGILASRLDN